MPGGGLPPDRGRARDSRRWRVRGGWPFRHRSRGRVPRGGRRSGGGGAIPTCDLSSGNCSTASAPSSAARRSEEHTSELQSPYDLVCRLLLEKKKKQDPATHQHG